MFPFSGNDFYVKKNFSPPKVMVDDHAFCAVMVCCSPSSSSRMCEKLVVTYTNGCRFN